MCSLSKRSKLPLSSSFAATCRVLLSASLYKGLSMQLQKAMVLMTLEVRLPSWSE